MILLVFIMLKSPEICFCHSIGDHDIPTNLQARYDLFCVKSAVKPQPTNQPDWGPCLLLKIEMMEIEIWSISLCPTQETVCKRSYRDQHILELFSSTSRQDLFFFG